MTLVVCPPTEVASRGPRAVVRAQKLVKEPDCGAPLEPYRRWRQSNLIECTPLMPAGLHDVSGDGVNGIWGRRSDAFFKSAAAHLQFEMRKFESRPWG